MSMPIEAQPWRLCVLAPQGPSSGWLSQCIAALVASDDIACIVRPVGAESSLSGAEPRVVIAATDLVIALETRAAAALDTLDTPLPQWLLSDASGRPLHTDKPLRDTRVHEAGIALQLWQRSHREADWVLLRHLHLAAPPRRACVTDALVGAVVRLLRQALVDRQLGAAPEALCGVLRPQLDAVRRAPGRGGALWFALRGQWRGAIERQRRRWLAEHWRLGIIEAPIGALLSSAAPPAVRWITQADGRGYWADPMAMGADDRRLFCEYFDERTGLGHLERLDLDPNDRVVQRTRLDVGGRKHASFPLVVYLDGRRLGLAETGARRECVLHEVGDDGQWRPLAKLLTGVAIGDPALFQWEGRYWLAGTDTDLGVVDNLCLWFADRVEGPWQPHANNPVKVDVSGSRMAGGFFGHESRLYRPAQDCLATYGAAVQIYRIERCTPTEFTETLVRRLEPDRAGPCPDGLHTISAWGTRTLVDGKRHAFSLTVLLRKLGWRRPALVGGHTERVCLYIPHLRLGGGETSLLRLAGGFARSGLNVSLVVHTMTTAELAVPEGVELIELHSDGTAGALLKLVRVLRQRRPDVLLSAFPHTNIAAVAAVALAGVKCLCVVSEHAPLSRQIREQGNWRYRLLPPLVRWAYGRADAVVAVSAGVRADLDALGTGRRAVQVIGNPVLPDAPQGADADAMDAPHPWFDDSSIEVVLSVSRLSVEKDIPTLIRALAALRAQRPQARLLIAGEGPERARLHALIAELGLEAAVQLIGRVTQPLAWMRRSAALALASRYEGFGNVLIEALASGLPVVSTDCPVGPREILQDGRFGELVDVGDWHAMAQALARALAQGTPPAGAREHALQFTEAAACTAYRGLFDDLAAGRRASRAC